MQSYMDGDNNALRFYVKLIEEHILSLLLRKKKLKIYAIYNETGLSSGNIVRFIKHYEKRLYLIKIGTNIYLTPIGWLLLSLKKKRMYMKY